VRSQGNITELPERNSREPFSATGSIVGKGVYEYWKIPHPLGGGGDLEKGKRKNTSKRESKDKGELEVKKNTDKINEKGQVKAKRVNEE
jgi:hypothetical protein